MGADSGAVGSAHPTWVIELSPPGRGAVAVVLVAGPEAVSAVERCFASASGRTLAAAPLGRILLGRWDGAAGEELVVCRRAAERVEVHCHGGVAAVRAVIERLIDLGCCEVSWSEWLRSLGRRVSPQLAITSPTASRRDATTCAAQIALAEAPTARTASILLDQFHGALCTAIRAAAEAVAAGQWQQAAEMLDGVLAFGELGRHLTAPWQVVLAGPPNVGKSSLINALAGYQRAIVSHVLGTTRDVVTTVTAIDGWPVQLADTAGLRDTTDELEAAGMALTDAALAQADLVLLVHDAAEHDRAADEIAARLPAAARVIQVRNKIDLLPDAKSGSSAIDTSAVTGEGMAELLAAIGAMLVPRAPAAGAAVPFTHEQVASLDTARAAIEQRDAAAIAALQALLAT
jgi:tRNA modification GTPase